MSEEKSFKAKVAMYVTVMMLCLMHWMYFADNKHTAKENETVHVGLSQVSINAQINNANILKVSQTSSRASYF